MIDNSDCEAIVKLFDSISKQLNNNKADTKCPSFDNCPLVWTADNDSCITLPETGCKKIKSRPKTKYICGKQQNECVCTPFMYYPYGFSGTGYNY